MTLTARHYDNAADILAGAHAVRMRLMKPRNAVIEIKSLPAPKPVETYGWPPMWRTKDLSFDEHVTTWIMHRLRTEKQKYQTYIRERCKEIGVPFESVIGESRTRDISWARQDIIYELRTVFTPPPTYPELGRIFRKDHSTLVHAVQAAAARAKKPKLKALSHIDMLRTDAALAQRVWKDWLAGKSLFSLSEIHRLSRDSIAEFAKEKGWRRQRPQNRVPGQQWTSYEDALKIRDAYYAGLPNDVIAATYGVGLRTITTLRHRYQWPARERIGKK